MKKHIIKKSITVINLAAFAFTKRIDGPVIERDGKLHYTITCYNNSGNDVLKFNILDILPYNGDNRGSNFKGTYTLDSLNITGYENYEDIQIYITSEDKLRDNEINAKTENLQDIVNLENIKTKDINKSCTEVLLSGRLSRDAIKKATLENQQVKYGQKLTYTIELDNTTGTAEVNENPTNSVTHTYQKEEEFINIKVIKKWEDRENKENRPEKVKIQVYEGKNLKQTHEITGYSSQEQWEYTFENLKKYDEEGNEIQYRIDEEELENSYYIKSSVTDPLNKTGEGYEGTIVNALEKTGSLKITKMERTKEEADAGEMGKTLRCRSYTKK